MQNLRSLLELPDDQDPRYEKHIKIPSKSKVSTVSKKRSLLEFQENVEPNNQNRESKKLKLSLVEKSEIDDQNLDLKLHPAFQKDKL